MPPLVEIGLTDLSKSGGAQAPPLATGLMSSSLIRECVRNLILRVHTAAIAAAAAGARA